MRTALMSLIAIAALSGCVSKKRYDELVLEQQRINEQKDSLVSDVLAATQLVTEINADLARVKGLGVSPVASGERPTAGAAAERTMLLGKVREVITRLEAAEQSLEEQKARVGTMTAERRRLTTQLESFQRTIEELKATALQQESLISDQQQTIRTLAERVDTLTQQTDELAREREELTETLTTTLDEANAVYYIAGTRDELIAKGVAVDEGRKLLIFGSKTLQPARELDPADFQRLDRRDELVLPVPEAGKDYRILTRQNPQYLASTITEDGKIRGDVKISSSKFWDGGRFLILVRD
jgi:outer membrane murein-binding lipoprotein Lpp